MAVKQKSVVGPVPPTPEVLQIILRVLQDIQTQDTTQTNVYAQIVAGLGMYFFPSACSKNVYLEQAFSQNALI